MNDKRLIVEPHSFHPGDYVYVCKRNDPEKKYNGKIYSIVNKLENKYTKNSPYVDHFYIAFDRCVYDSLLQRGWSIIYNRKEEILGDIERNRQGEIININIQSEFDFVPETEIDIEKINAILIWRVAHMIEPMS